jgi:molybdopterin-guanine dinucleotide biosynthesis protein MobB
LDGPFVVRVTGPGRNVGKTTLASALIGLLTERGLRVAAVKRSHHPLPAERPGSDTDRFAEAGAATVAFQAPDGILLRRRSEPALAESLGALGDGHDVVVVEGFRDERIGAAIRLDHLGTARLESEAGEVVLATAGADVVALADALEELCALSVGAAQSASPRGQRRSRPEL